MLELLLSLAFVYELGVVSFTAWDSLNELNVLDQTGHLYVRDNRISNSEPFLVSHAAISCLIISAAAWERTVELRWPWPQPQ